MQVHDLGALRRADIAALIGRLNESRDCHGILVQSPVELGLGPAIPVVELASLIDPQKDVDGLNPINMGRLASRSAEAPLHLPCTPQGVISLLRHYALDDGVAGSRAVVVGRSDIVGMPMSFLLNRLNATVTLCHSQTKDLPTIVGQADLLIAAIGRPGHVRGHWIRPGAIVIDVGISRGLGQSQPVGDVEFEEAQLRASAITPVPGGVGPMTVAMLARNLFVAALRAENVSGEEILPRSPGDVGGGIAEEKCPRTGGSEPQGLEPRGPESQMAHK